MKTSRILYLVVLFIFSNSAGALAASETKVVATVPASGGEFGYSVAIDGDYAIVGAWYEGSSVEGAAYIYQRTGENTWSAPTKIVSPDGEAGALFGCSVAISGDYAIVGAYEGMSFAGAAYIFHRTGDNTWDAGTRIVAADSELALYFGISVGISGEYAIVGAYYTTVIGIGHTGAAYIFHRTDTTWDAGTKILASDGQESDFFGNSVGISGDYAIVGALQEDPGDVSEAGSAYIYQRTDTNTWGEEAKIVASVPGESDNFGYAVAISGDYAIVGSPYEDTGGDNAGAAYTFHRTGANTWEAGPTIVASDPAAWDYFGYSVSLSGPYAIVGAYGEDPNSVGSAGSAYLFNRTDVNTWSSATKIWASDGSFSDEYGISVSINGYYAVIGAHRDDPAAASDAGSAYIYKHDLPTAIDLLGFTAEWTDAGAALSWLTGSETECGAFTLLRCELGDVREGAEPNCPPADFAELDLVIPCEDSAYGAEYEALDATADPNANYSYMLREYETTGDVKDYGPVLLVSLKYSDEAPGGASSDDDENPGDDDETELPDDDADAADDDESGESAAESEDAEEDDGAGCGM